jgi:hypothetical protein
MPRLKRLCLGKLQNFIYKMVVQRTPNEAFFIEIQNFWAWEDKFMGIWGIFGRTISTQLAVT